MNAKKEFIEHIGTRSVLCAKISGLGDREIFLTTGWTEEDWIEFLNDLDFDYDSGYGLQNLFGLIWYKDGNWSSRGEYYGSEWWVYHSCPLIPKELNRLDKVREQRLNKIL